MALAVCELVDALDRDKVQELGHCGEPSQIFDDVILTYLSDINHPVCTVREVRTEHPRRNERSHGVVEDGPVAHIWMRRLGHIQKLMDVQVVPDCPSIAFDRVDCVGRWFHVGKSTTVVPLVSRTAKDVGV